MNPDFDAPGHQTSIETSVSTRDVISLVAWENAGQGDHETFAGVGGMQGGGKRKGQMDASELKKHLMDQWDWALGRQPGR